MPLPVLLQARSLKVLAAILLSLESLFGAMFGIIGGYDKLSARFVLGGVCMIVAVMLPAFEDYLKEKKEMAEEK